MTLTIRRAEPSDGDAVAGLQADATAWLGSKGLRQWQPGQPRATARANALTDAISRGKCYLAFEGNELVGTITVDDYADREFWTEDERAEPALYLHRMIVDRRYAGHGLGQLLLDFAQDLATATGARWLRLDAWKDNTDLHAYYAGQGFRHVRTVDLPHRGSGALFQRPVSQLAASAARRRALNVRRTPGKRGFQQDFAGHLRPLQSTRKRRQKRAMTRLFAWSSLVVGTGVDPVTFRFSGGRSAN